jgi:gluconolactonase
MIRAGACLWLCAAAASAQDYSKLTVEKVHAGSRFTEGPVWSKEGFLLFSDVPNDRILKLVPGEKAILFREKSNGANGNAYDAQGRLYSCESKTRRVVRADKDGKLETIADKWEGKRLNAPNDIVVSRQGHVYFTDPAFGDKADHRELDFYGIYHLPPKGPMKLIARPAGRPNGIALSPNGRILYVTNTDEHNVRAYDVDGKGEVSNERVLVTGIEGSADGLRVDEKGNLYVAARAVAIYSPTGTLIHSIDIGETPSNVAFGEADLKTLYVTARTSVYRVRLDVKGAVQH